MTLAKPELQIKLGNFEDDLKHLQYLYGKFQSAFECTSV